MTTCLLILQSKNGKTSTKKTVSLLLLHRFGYGMGEGVNF